MPTLSLITTCMGRLAFLKQSLPRMVEQRDCSCIVVDYSCPDQSGRWVEEHYSQVTVLRVPGQSSCNPAAPRNVGAAVAHTPWLCFVDADVVLDPRFSEIVVPTLMPGHFYRVPHFVEGLCGTCICSRQDFDRIGGYDDVYQNWSGEDDDFYEALRFVGVTAMSLSPSLLRHLEHGDDLRMVYCSLQNRELSRAINGAYRRIKWDIVQASGHMLPRETRAHLYANVAQLVPSFVKGGEATDLRINLGSVELTHGCHLLRNLHYRFASVPQKTSAS